MRQPWKPPSEFCRKRDREPYNQSIEALRERYPYVVTFYSFFGRGPTHEECDAAFNWAIRQTEFDFEINNAGVWFHRQEDAVLFKLGFWLVEMP